MRIEAYTQVQQVYKSRKSGYAQAAYEAAGTKDQLEISSIGKDFQTVKAALAETPDIRENLTAAIKSKVQDGTYHVDNESFAAKLFERYNALA